MSYQDMEGFKILFDLYPKTWALISKRRYQLPQHLVMDYLSQDSDCEDTFGRIFSYLPTIVEDIEADESGSGNMSPSHQCVTLLNWVDHQSKTLWMERDLGEMLLRTEILPDLTVNDLLFPWPVFKVMLPFGLIPLHDGSGGSITSIIISHEVDEVLVPEIIWKEMSKLPNIPKSFKFATKSGNTERLAMIYTTAHNRDDDNTGLYQMWEALDNCGLQKSVDMVKTAAMTFGSEMEQNRSSVKEAKHLALNLLIYLSTVPAVSKETECVRKEKTIGKHIRPAIYKPQWVGGYVFQQFKALHPKHHELTGRHVEGHWVKGHWRRTPHGKPNKDGKLIIWIMPYRTYGVEETVKA